MALDAKCQVQVESLTVAHDIYIPLEITYEITAYFGGNQRSGTKAALRMKLQGTRQLASEANGGGFTEASGAWAYVRGWYPTSDDNTNP